MGNSNWEYYSLGDLTENFDSFRVPIKETNRKKGQYPYYGASGIIDMVDGYLFDGEYLLVAEDGENLKSRKTPIAFMASGKFWVNNHAHIIRGNEKADTRFLMYFLGQADISGFLTGSTLPKLTQDNLNRIPVLLPPLPEQRAIAGILGALDDKIELNRRMNRTLESIARAVFRQWFVESEEVGSWKVGKFGEISEIRRDSINPGLFPDEIFNHYSIPAYDETRFPAHESGNQIKSNKFIISDRCVLISKLNPEIQRIWLPLTLEGRSICSTEFLVNVPKGCFTPEFLYGLFYSQSFQDRFVSMTTGTSGSHQRVKAEYVLDMEVELPPENLVAAYTEMVKPMLKKVQQNILESRTLASLRDSLLPKLMRGEVRVRG